MMLLARRIVLFPSGKPVGNTLAAGQAFCNSNANVVQFTDNGSTDHLWRLLYGSGGFFHIQNQNSSKVLGVSDMSTADSANIVQFTDNGTADHPWRFY